MKARERCRLWEDAWVRVSDAAPPLYDATAAFDPTGDRLLVWGGCPDATCVQRRSTLWAMNPASGEWSQPETQGEAPPAGPAAALYDPTDDTLVVVVTALDDSHRVFVLPLSGDPVWAERDAHPLPRTEQSAVWHDGAMLMFGGIVGLSDAERFADPTVWRWDGAHWTALPGAGGPGPRSGAGMVTAEGEVLLHGGLDDGNQHLGDTWSLAAGAAAVWTPIAPAGALAARSQHRPVARPGVRGFRVFGGLTFDSTPLGDGADLDNQDGVWRWVPHASAAPPARFGHAVVYEPSTNLLVLTGGFEDGDDLPVRDLWTSPADGAAVWTEPALEPGPLPDIGLHAAAAIGGGRIALLGGLGRALDWRIVCHDSERDPEWRWGDLPAFDVGEGPCGYLAASLLYDADTDTIIVYGGANDSRCSQVWRYRVAATLTCPP